MKKFFRLVSMFALAGATLAYTGCTDYDEDIDKINDRIDKIESSTTGELNTIKEQMAGMKTQIGALETARDNALKEIEDLKKTDASLNKLIEDLDKKHDKDIEKVTADYKKAVADLKAIHDADKAALEAALDAAKKDFAKKIADLEKTHADDVAAIDAQIRIIHGELDGLHKDVAGINEAISKINETIATLATKQELKDHAAHAEATYATKAALEEANVAIGKLQGRMDAAEKNLSALLKSLVALTERVGTDEIAIEAAQSAANKAQAAAEAAQASADDAQELANMALGNITSLKAALGVYANAGALEAKFQAIQIEMNANKAAAEKAIENLKNEDEKIYAALEEQDETLRALLEEKLSALNTEIQGKLSEINGLISDLEENKLDVEDFDEAFEVELAKALEEGKGAIDKAIASKIQALSDEVNAKIDTINSNVEKVKARLNTITNILDVLADRIQSVVFVPEYNDGKASANSYVFKSGSDKLVLSKDVVVKGTFKVTPARLASAVEEYAKANQVFVKAVGTKDAATRAADTDVDAKKVVVTAGDGGRLEIEATFPATVIAASENPVIALYIYGGETAETDENDNPSVPPIDTKNYISSSYVPVAVVEKDLFGSYVLYNGTKEYKADDDHAKKQWSEWPGEYTFAKGYTPYLKINGKYYTPAEAEKLLTLPEGSLVPTRKSTIDYYDNLNNPLTGANKYKALKATEKGWETDVKMQATSKVGAMDHVDYWLKNTLEMQLNFGAGKGFKSAETYVTSYVITRRQYDIVIDPMKVAWSYETAVKLSATKSAADLYSEPIDKNFDTAFSEIDVTMPSIDVKELDLATILAGPVTKKHALKIGGNNIATIPAGLNLTVDPVAILKHKIANVGVEGYRFSNQGESVYSFCNQYANDATKTDVNVRFELTLGAVPVPEVMDLGNQTIDYVPTFKYHSFAESKTMGAAFDQVKAYFANYATFKGDIEAQVPVRTADVAKKTSVNPNVNVSAETRFAPIGTPDAGYKYYLRLHSNDVKSYADTYSFKTTYKTWYNVEYVFTATADLKQPTIHLEYFNDWVNTAADGSRYADLKGKMDAGKYVIDTDDLSKYFYVEEVAGSGIDHTHITVEYKVLTASNTTKGILNVPDPATPIASVNASGHIAASEIAWRKGTFDYTAQKLDVRAILRVNDIEVNRKDITLKIADPIVDFKAAQINATRVPHADKIVNLWSTMKVYGVNAPATNLVNNGAANFASMWNYNADAAYDLDLTFGTSYTVTVGGVDKTAAYAGKIVYNAAEGTVTYKADAAEQVEPVYVSIDATLKHKYGYNGLENHKVRVEVVFNEE